MTIDKDVASQHNMLHIDLTNSHVSSAWGTALE